jgi:prepilin-type N-terminal cleavage/methylation domain-containing protein
MTSAAVLIPHMGWHALSAAKGVVERPATPFVPHGVPPVCRGYTLLEVLLSLVLVALVLLCIGMAVDFQLRIADAGRTHIEEAQLARVLLQQIADDLRGAIAPNADAEASASASLDSAESEMPAEGDAGESEEAEEESATATVDFADSAELSTSQSTPGLYGEMDWIQFDTSRLPRIHEVRSALTLEADTVASSRYSDAKTVTYYVADSQESVWASETAAGSGGLVREVTDRIVSVSGLDSGEVVSSEVAPSPLAPEIAWIQFYYSDGTSWYDYWDMAEMGTLPVAVEVTIAVRPPGIQTSQGLLGPTATDSLDESEDVEIYSLVVDLPAARSRTGTSTDAMMLEDLMGTESTESEVTP